MATFYPKTSLSLRTKDENLNAKTFSIGYVNAEAGDGTLKALAEKIVELSDLTLQEIYKTTQNDITNAYTDSTLILSTTSAFTSNDPATFIAAVNALDGADTGDFIVNISKLNAAANISIQDLQTWVQNNNKFNAQSFATVINQRLFSPQLGVKAVEFGIAEGSFIWNFGDVATGNYTVTISGTDIGARQLIESLYEGASAEDKSKFSGTSGNRQYTGSIRVG